MEIRKLSNALSVAAQIAAAGVSGLAALGFRSLICNRPDGEGADQPNFAEIAQAAQSAELAVRYLPVTSGKVSDESAVEFRQALIELPGPTLAYCRTGMRPTTLWALSGEAGKIVLAEFGYGGKLLPSFARWLLDGTRPSRAAWILKERRLPPIDRQAMLKGREWLAKPELVG